MSTTQQPEALAADHSEQTLEMVARWYMIDKDGMAMLCTDREDAEKEAKNANMAWPHTAPHRAVQLVEVADVEALRTGYAAARPAGAQQPGVATWTPLPGTLPEPGKPVLLDIGMEYPIRAMWAAKHTLEVGMDDDSGFGEYDETTDTYYCPEGWYEWNEHEETHWAVDETPTAWCELPPNGGASHGQAPAQAAPVCGSPADLPPLPDPDLRDVGTKPEDIKNFLRGYATEYAKAALASSAPADSVLEDAARWKMAVLVGNEVMMHPEKRTHPAAVKAYMDAVHSGLDLTGAIDAARKQGANHD